MYTNKNKLMFILSGLLAGQPHHSSRDTLNKLQGILLFSSSMGVADSMAHTRIGVCL